jgi:hypothetical protein
VVSAKSVALKVKAVAFLGPEVIETLVQQGNSPLFRGRNKTRQTAGRFHLTGTLAHPR